MSQGWQCQHAPATAAQCPWEMPGAELSPRVAGERRCWVEARNLVLVGSKEGFDLLPHVQSGAVAQGSHQCKIGKEDKTSLKKANEDLAQFPGPALCSQVTWDPPGFPGWCRGAEPSPARLPTLTCK